MNNTLLKFLALNNSEPLTYDLDIPPAEARRLLEKAAEAEGDYLFSKRFPLRFKNDRDFQIYRVRNKNSYRRILRASLSNQGNGTHLLGSFETSTFIMWFSILWLLLALGSSIYLLSVDWQSNLGSLIFPIFGVVLPRIGRATARSDERAVLELFEKAYTGHITLKDTPGY